MKADIRNWLVGQFGEDEDVIGEIYAEYVGSSRAKVVELRAALDAGDLGQVDRIAHAMKGTSLMTGDQEAAEAAIALRKAALAGDREGCRVPAERLTALIGALEEPGS